MPNAEKSLDPSGTNHCENFDADSANIYAKFVSDEHLTLFCEYLSSHTFRMIVCLLIGFYGFDYLLLTLFFACPVYQDCIFGHLSVYHSLSETWDTVFRRICGGCILVFAEASEITCDEQYLARTGLFALLPFVTFRTLLHISSCSSAPG
jgi:hypothetical protein